MFLDASAVAAILIPEEDGPVLEERLNAAKRPFFTSPVSVLESIIAVAKSLRENQNTPVTEEMMQVAQTIVTEYLAMLQVKEITIGPDIGRKAQEAMLTYGKIIRHPAQLNLGDCLAYACAKAYNSPLLYKGNDFAQTDLA